MARYVRSLIAASAVSLLPLAAHAELIANGLFTSTCGSGSFCTYGAGNSTDIPGWTVGSGSVDLITGYWQAPFGGGNNVDLDGYYQAADLYTSFATVAGRKYKVTFELSGNPDGGAPLKTVRVGAAASSADYAFNTSIGNSHGDMMWAPQTFIFTATGALTTLDFQSLDAAESAFGPAIGNVSANGVPEPASLALFASGLLGLSFRRRAAKRA